MFPVNVLQRPWHFVLGWILINAGMPTSGKGATGMAPLDKVNVLVD